MEFLEINTVGYFIIAVIIWTIISWHPTKRKKSKLFLDVIFVVVFFISTLAYGEVIINKYWKQILIIITPLPLGFLLGRLINKRRDEFNSK